MEKRLGRQPISQFILDVDHTVRNLTEQGPIAVRLSRQASRILEERREDQLRPTTSKDGVLVRVSQRATISTENQREVELRLRDVLGWNKIHCGIVLEASLPGSSKFTTLFGFMHDGIPHITNWEDKPATEAQKEIAENLLSFMEDELRLKHSPRSLYLVS